MSSHHQAASAPSSSKEKESSSSAAPPGQQQQQQEGRKSPSNERASSTTVVRGKHLRAIDMLDSRTWTELELIAGWHDDKDSLLNDAVARLDKLDEAVKKFAARIKKVEKKINDNEEMFLRYSKEGERLFRSATAFGLRLGNFIDPHSPDHRIAERVLLIALDMTDPKHGPLKFEQGFNMRLRAVALNNLATVLAQAKRYVEAVDKVQKARAVEAELGPAAESPATTMFNEAQIYYLSGRTIEALQAFHQTSQVLRQHLDKAISDKEKSTVGGLLLASLRQLAGICEATHRYQDAILTLEDALVLARRVEKTSLHMHDPRKQQMKASDVVARDHTGRKMTAVREAISADLKRCQNSLEHARNRPRSRLQPIDLPKPLTFEEEAILQKQQKEARRQKFGERGIETASHHDWTHSPAVLGGNLTCVAEAETLKLTKRSTRSPAANHYNNSNNNNADIDSAKSRAEQDRALARVLAPISQNRPKTASGSSSNQKKINNVGSGPASSRGHHHHHQAHQTNFLDDEETEKIFSEDYKIKTEVPVPVSSIEDLVKSLPKNLQSAYQELQAKGVEARVLSKDPAPPKAKSHRPALASQFSFDTLDGVKQQQEGSSSDAPFSSSSFLPQLVNQYQASPDQTVKQGRANSTVVGAADQQSTVFIPHSHHRKDSTAVPLVVRPPKKIQGFGGLAAVGTTTRSRSISTDLKSLIESASNSPPSLKNTNNNDQKMMSPTNNNNNNNRAQSAPTSQQAATAATSSHHQRPEHLKAASPQELARTPSPQPRIEGTNNNNDESSLLPEQTKSEQNNTSISASEVSPHQKALRIPTPPALGANSSSSSLRASNTIPPRPPSADLQQQQRRNSSSMSLSSRHGSMSTNRFGSRANFTTNSSSTVPLSANFSTTFNGGASMSSYHSPTLSASSRRAKPRSYKPKSVDDILSQTFSSGSPGGTSRRGGGGDYHGSSQRGGDGKKRRGSEAFQLQIQSAAEEMAKKWREEEEFRRAQEDSRKKKKVSKNSAALTLTRFLLARPCRVLVIEKQDEFLEQQVRFLVADQRRSAILLAREEMQNTAMARAATDFVNVWSNMQLSRTSRTVQMVEAANRAEELSLQRKQSREIFLGKAKSVMERLEKTELALSAKSIDHAEFLRRDTVTKFLQRSEGVRIMQALLRAVSSIDTRAHHTHRELTNELAQVREFNFRVATATRIQRWFRRRLSAELKRKAARERRQARLKELNDYQLLFSASLRYGISRNIAHQKKAQRLNLCLMKFGAVIRGFCLRRKLPWIRWDHERYLERKKLQSILIIQHMRVFWKLLTEFVDPFQGLSTEDVDNGRKQYAALRIQSRYRAHRYGRPWMVKLEALKKKKAEDWHIFIAAVSIQRWWHRAKANVKLRRLKHQEAELKTFYMKKELERWAGNVLLRFLKWSSKLRRDEAITMWEAEAAKRKFILCDEMRRRICATKIQRTWREHNAYRQSVVAAFDANPPFDLFLGLDNLDRNAAAEGTSSRSGANEIITTRLEVLREANLTRDVRENNPALIRSLEIRKATSEKKRRLSEQNMLNQRAASEPKVDVIMTTTDGNDDQQHHQHIQDETKQQQQQQEEDNKQQPVTEEEQQKAIEIQRIYRGFAARKFVKEVLTEAVVSKSFEASRK